MSQSKPSIIVIAGPTASGKSDVAISLAKKLGGEIICADSRTVYKSLSIGVAKPTAMDQKRIKHHCLDLAELGHPINAYDFKLAAEKAIKNIRSRGKLPIIVGGSGLYIDAVIYDFKFKNKSDSKVRSKLNNMDITDLHKVIKAKNLPMPENYMNKRHLIRVIETAGQQAGKSKKLADVIYTGLLIDNNALKGKISARVELMYDRGFLEEVRLLSNKYSEEQVRSAGIGYGSAVDYLQGKVHLNFAKQCFIKGDVALAKRQRTWFKRNPDIKWFASPELLENHILNLMNK